MKTGDVKTVALVQVAGWKYRVQAYMSEKQGKYYALSWKHGDEHWSRSHSYSQVKTYGDALDRLFKYVQQHY